MLYTEAEIRKKVADTLLPRVGFVRGAVLEPIETYSRPIPDDALIKYDDAIQTGVFSKFLVATPRYYGQRQVDPWIVGQVGGTELWAVIAQWDVGEESPDAANTRLHRASRLPRCRRDTSRGLVVNLTTARALGLTVPPSVLARAVRSSSRSAE